MPLQCDDDDDDDIDDEPFSPCPFCLEMIHSEVAQCPYCKNYISQEQDASDRKPRWFLLGIAAFAIFLLVLAVEFFQLPLSYIENSKQIKLHDAFWIAGLIFAAIVALFLMNVLIRHFYGVSLLCHVGIHRWQKDHSGTGRDRRHELTCRKCGAHKNEY